MYSGITNPRDATVSSKISLSSQHHAAPEDRVLMDEEGIDRGDEDFDIQNIQSVKLKFFEEVEGLFELAESLGLENNLSQRILRTANNLKRMQGVFLYVEYSDACAAKTPKLVRDLVEKTFNHEQEMDVIKSRIIHEWLDDED